jgi:FG-GAP repeat
MNTVKKWNFVVILALASSLFAINTHAALAAVWVQDLVRSDNEINENFGFSVDIDGDRAVIGAWLDDDKGAAYVFHYNGVDWVEESKLLQPGGVANNRFGVTVAIEGDVIVVGAPTDSGDGSAWVFTRVDETWNTGAELDPGELQHQYGMSVAIDNGTIVVGERWDGFESGLDNIKGAAHIFEPTTGILWAHVAKLLPPSAGHDFGTSVDIDTDTIIVGAPMGEGVVYAFEKGSGWIDTTAGDSETLPSSDVISGDFYGWAIAISGDLVVVGAQGDDANDGSITVLDRSSGWVAAPKILAPDSGRFGTSVAVDGQVVIAGAPQTDGSVGSFYLFSPDGVGGWSLDDSIKSATVDRLGRDVALDGATLLVGAGTAQFGMGEGVIYDISGIVTPPTDDGDDIAAAIDGTFSGGAFTDESTEFSNNFTDQEQAGTSYGSITDRADLIVTIDDTPSAGVDVTASGGGGGTAEIEACSSPVAVFHATHLDAFEITCGSVMTSVTTGPVEITIPPGITVSVPTDGAVTVSEDTSTDTLSVLNTGGPAITVNGETVASGETVEFEPVADDDDDSDGVLNGGDSCPNTQADAVVDSAGCAIADYCPCGADWRNHGAYVSCIGHTAKKFAKTSLISRREKGQASSQAARSSCGK